MQHKLSAEQINEFIADGFIRIDEAFPASMAADVRDYPLA